MNIDFYVVLQVDPSADPEVVEAAYKRLARKFHPDVSREPDAEKRMRALNEAFGVLGSASRRESYDRQRMMRIRSDSVAARDARQSTWCSSSSSPRSTPSNSPDAQAARESAPGSGDERPGLSRTSSKRRRDSATSRVGHRQARRASTTVGAADEKRTTGHGSVYLEKRARGPRRIIFSRTGLIKWIDTANRAFDLLRFRVNRFGLSSANRFPSVQLWGKRAFVVPAVDPWHVGLVASFGIAIILTMSIGSFVAGIFEPDAQLQAMRVAESHRVLVHNGSRAVPTQIVLRRPVATPNVWPPYGYLESHNAGESVVPALPSDRTISPVDTERTPDVRISESDRPNAAGLQGDVQKVNAGPRGMLNVLRSAAAAFGHRTLGPRPPIPPSPPYVPSS